MYLVDLAPLWQFYSYVDQREQGRSWGDIDYDEESLPQEKKSPDSFGLEMIPRRWCIPRIVSRLISEADLDMKNINEEIGLDRPISDIIVDAIERNIRSLETALANFPEANVTGVVAESPHTLRPSRTTANTRRPYLVAWWS
jgi:hypothetical protein